MKPGFYGSQNNNEYEKSTFRRPKVVLYAIRSTFGHLEVDFLLYISPKNSFSKFDESQIDVIMSKPEILAFHRPQQEISPRGFGFMEYAIISDILKRGFVTDESFLTIKIQMNIV
jgi:hypothetical protein